VKGAEEYLDLFEMAIQYGGLYIVPYRDVINGDTLSVYVLPPNTHAIVNGKDKPPKNDCVKVYGQLKDKRGWLDECGWLFHGPWEKDFNELVIKLRERKEGLDAIKVMEQDIKDMIEREHQQQILDSY
jgi:hypothetical protein